MSGGNGGGGLCCNFSLGWRVLSVLPSAPLTPPPASLRSSRDPTSRSVHLLGDVSEEWGGGQRAGTGETGRVLSWLGVKREQAVASSLLRLQAVENVKMVH